MSADLSFPVSNEKGVVVPLKAVTAEPETRRVEIGSSDGRNVIVTEGLDVGEIVVIPGVAPVAPTAAAKSSGSSIIPISVPGTGGGSR